MKYLQSKRFSLTILFSIILIMLCVIWQPETGVTEAEQELQRRPPTPDNDWNYWSDPPGIGTEATDPTHMYSIPTGNVGIGTSNPNKIRIRTESSEASARF